MRNAFRSMRHWLRVRLVFLGCLCLVPCCLGQNPPPPQQQPTPTTDQQAADQHAKRQINVSWLYGSYVPKDVPLQPLNNHQRFKLYLRQTYITWGIYIKTGLFAAQGQIQNTPPQWGREIEGFGKRVLSYQGQFILLNTISSAGNAVVQWEPRYERCRCNGFWPRTRHAIVRNFVTYDRTEKSLRPQIMPYLGAFGGGAIAAAAWLPGNPSPTIKGYQGAIEQVFVGVGVDWLAEFAPELFGWLHKDKKKKPKPAGDTKN